MDSCLQILWVFLLHYSHASIATWGESNAVKIEFELNPALSFQIDQLIFMERGSLYKETYS